VSKFLKEEGADNKAGVRQGIDRLSLGWGNAAMGAYSIYDLQGLKAIC